MKLILSVVVHTANILGIFNDPFEFEGDYGPEVNPIRQKVFERVVSREALMNNLSDRELRELLGGEASEKEIAQYRHLLTRLAAEKEKNYGPTLSELVPLEFREELQQKQLALEEAGFQKEDLEKIFSFLDKYGDQRVFRFLRNNPPELLKLDKALRDQAAREGKSLSLPILGSTHPLPSTDPIGLKKELLKAVFTEKTFQLTKPKKSVETSLSGLDPAYLQEFFGPEATTSDLEVFSSPAGQTFFYWMYQSLNLDLLSSEPGLIEQVNQAKGQFGATLGNPVARAKQFQEQLLSSNSGVLFTQESDALLVQLLTQEGLFLPVDHQNEKDGTFVFLRSDLWEPDYQIISIDNYEGAKEGRLNVLLATRKGSGQKVLLASAHGHSTQAEDGRRQISLVMEAFHRLNDGNLQLLIGADANTKKEEDVQRFQEHLDHLGLVSTQVGPTTVKKRMVSAQHSKVGKFAVDEEDYLITLKPEKGGYLSFSDITVGFERQEVNPNRPLPTLDHPSDHYPVGATISSL